jgi:hypothetical protein
MVAQKALIVFLEKKYYYLIRLDAAMKGSEMMYFIHILSM